MANSLDPDQTLHFVQTSLSKSWGFYSDNNF